MVQKANLPDRTYQGDQFVAVPGLFSSLGLLSHFHLPNSLKDFPLSADSGS